MSHQAHNIPWNVFGSNLKFRTKIPCADDATSLHFRFKPTQGKELTYFVDTFTRNVHEHADSERRKYPEAYEVPGLDDIVLDDSLTRKMTHAVRLWRSERRDKLGEVDEKPTTELCHHSEPDQRCRCPLSYNQRRMGSFFHKYRWSDCYKFFDDHKDGYISLEVFKTLLMHGEMDTLLKICAHPGVGFPSWWDARLCSCYPPDLGRDYLENALDAYLVLNIFLSSFPKSWAPGRSLDQDYRRTRIYQMMILRVTGTRQASELATHPHRQVFGIARGQLNSYSGFKYPMTTKRQDKFCGTDQPYGRLTYEEFLESQKTIDFLPSVSDVLHVRWILCEKGLPGEIAQLILDKALYKPQRRLKVPHDPLHPENIEELNKYLKFCWQVLVRSEVVARETGMNIPWKDLVSESTDRLLGCSCRKLLGRGEPPNDDLLWFK
ncbi:unnamed protein product [Clonostachys rosea]|uniref:EF-hand domain-containing protein n=1 Tax=Bionectria ochroleuca TaxID=29856 RepID=A0ABY6UN75_BIOOC|nr:unnamed protein product [Clonostachys rosea]